VGLAVHGTRTPSEPCQWVACGLRTTARLRVWGPGGRRPDQVADDPRCERRRSEEAERTTPGILGVVPFL